MRLSTNECMGDYVCPCTKIAAQGSDQDQILSRLRANSRQGVHLSVLRFKAQMRGQRMVTTPAPIAEAVSTSANFWSCLCQRQLLEMSLL